MYKPFISIVVSAYNIENWISDCLESILVQSFEHFELIIVDDFSTDGTAKIISEYAAKDARIKQVKHSKNHGLARTRKTGLSHAQGDYLWQIDGDDYIAPNALAHLVTIIKQDSPDIIRGRLLLDCDGKIKMAKWFEKWPFVSNANLNNCPVLFQNPFGLCLNIVRAKFLRQLGIINPDNINLGEDLIFNAVAYARANSISMTSEVIYFYRQRQESLSSRVNLADYHFEEEAAAHAIVSETWKDFSLARIAFAYCKTPARWKNILNAGLYTDRSRTLKTIQEYRKVYQNLDMSFCHALLQATQLGPLWSPPEQMKFFDFVIMMQTRKPPDIYDIFIQNIPYNTVRVIR